MSRVLALDQSSKVTGWAIYDNGKLEKYGKINRTEEDPILRIQNLRIDIQDMIQQENIQEVILEDIQMQGNVNNVVTFKVLAFVLGALELLCLQMEIPYRVIGSSTWKSTCGIKGRARAEQKRDAQRFVLETFQVEAIQDIVDAICIGYAATNKERSFNWE